LIFDEPFSGFDPINAAIIRKEIVHLSQKGITIIFSTHRMESVEEICNHIALINKSKTILEGTIESIKQQFTNNSYEVITKNVKLENNDLYDVISNEEDTFNILLKEGVSGKDALHYINTNYEVVSFKKESPTMEEIFIKAVNNA
jgi:ABC-2 type transport system ATP-binding protein